MKHSKLTALLCALVMTGAGSMSAFAADAAPAYPPGPAAAWLRPAGSSPSGADTLPR